MAGPTRVRRSAATPCIQLPTIGPGSALPSGDLPAALDRLTNALADAHAARRGVPVELRPIVAAYAKAARASGVEIGAFLVDVKQIIRRTTGQDEALFIPKVVGWAIAGFFEGTSSRG